MAEERYSLVRSVDSPILNERRILYDHAGHGGEIEFQKYDGDSWENELMLSGVIETDEINSGFSNGWTGNVNLYRRGKVVQISGNLLAPDPYEGDAVVEFDSDWDAVQDLYFAITMPDHTVRRGTVAGYALIIDGNAGDAGEYFTFGTTYLIDQDA